MCAYNMSVNVGEWWGYLTRVKAQGHTHAGMRGGAKPRKRRGAPAEEEVGQADAAQEEGDSQQEHHDAQQHLLNTCASVSARPWCEYVVRVCV